MGVLNEKRCKIPFSFINRDLSQYDNTLFKIMYLDNSMIDNI